MLACSWVLPEAWLSHNQIQKVIFLFFLANTYEEWWCTSCGSTVALNYSSQNLQHSKLKCSYHRKSVENKHFIRSGHSQVILRCAALCTQFLWQISNQKKVLSGLGSSVPHSYTIRKEMAFFTAWKRHTRQINQTKCRFKLLRRPFRVRKLNETPTAQNMKWFLLDIS